MFKFMLVLFMAICLVTSCKNTGKSEEEKHGNEHAEADREESEEPAIVLLDKEGQNKIQLQLAPVTENAVQQTIRFNGTVQPNETRIAHLKPITTGRIVKVFVRSGAKVARGTPLLAYDNIEAGDLQAEYRQAAARLQTAKNSVERAKRLLEIGAVARSEYERRQSEHQQAQAEFQSADAKLKRLGLGGSTSTQTTLRAPFPGVVTKAEASEGEFIGPEQEVFTVADLSSVWAVANVYEKDIGKVRLGQQAEVRSEAYADEIFTGRVTSIGDTVDPATRTIAVRCELENASARLKLGMFVSVEIPTTGVRSTLMVPSSAVQEIDGKLSVFVQVAENKFQKREVETGATTADFTEILRGLQKGENVVTQGSFSLKSELLKEQIGEDEHGH